MQTPKMSQDQTTIHSPPQSPVFIHPRSKSDPKHPAKKSKAIKTPERTGPLKITPPIHVQRNCPLALALSALFRLFPQLAPPVQPLLTLNSRRTPRSNGRLPRLDTPHRNRQKQKSTLPGQNSNAPTLLVPTFPLTTKHPSLLHGCFPKAKQETRGEGG